MVALSREMSRGSDFNMIIVNTYLFCSLVIGWSFTCVPWVSCPCVPTFFMPFGLFCVLLTIIILISAILAILFGFKVTLGVASP